ncbi:hypothetical protein ACIG87_29300 [Micromonospora sp. NPDC051925]|uniref:hypothetical protein n=1 Tax=Micromonospora sp. NPDC051925 TaxID=3364288 RepID=UPI0037C6A33A
MAEATGPEPQHDQPQPTMDVRAEALALMTIGSDLRRLLARRNSAGEQPSADEIEAIKFVNERLTRLPSEPAAQPAANRPSRPSAASGSAAFATDIQWQDEFLNLLVRTAKRVKRWLEGSDEGTNRLDLPSAPAPDVRLPSDLPDVRDLDSIDPRSDLYQRTCIRLGELLDQSPALKQLSSNGDLDHVSKHLPRRGNSGPGSPALAGIAAMPSLRVGAASGQNREARRAESGRPAHLRSQSPRARSARQ